jgi:hypothetical protein
MKPGVFLQVSTKIIFLISMISLTANAGGVSGGGGNVLSPRPPNDFQNPEHVEQLVKKSKMNLQDYIQQKKQIYFNGEMNSRDQNLYGSIFETQVPMDQVIRSIKVDVEEHRPCYDKNLNPVDGSIHANKTNAICVSALRLAEKVHVQEIPAQSTALMMHEYSEVMGFDEDFAVQIQKRTLEDF